MKFAIIGTGIMGCGWITQCAMTGHEVHCYNEKSAISGTQYSRLLGKPSALSPDAGCHSPFGTGQNKPWQMEISV